MSRNKVVVEEGVVRVVTVGIQGPPGVGISQAYVDAGDAASRQRANHTGTQPSSTISDFNTAADARIEIQKGFANGVATLGSDAKIPTSQLPALAITDTFVVASQAAMLALTAEVGDVAVRTDLGKSFILRVTGASTLANWQELLTPTDAVLSVNGQTGAVTGLASLNSPAFTGIPTGPTAAPGTNTTQLATTAYADAAAAASTPDATSLVKGKVQLAGDLGGTAASPTVVGVSRRFSWKDYGVVADGVTNDRAHYQAMIDAIHAAGGGIGEVAPGTSYIPATASPSGARAPYCGLVMYDDVTLVGHGAHLSVFTTDAIVQQGATRGAVYFSMFVNASPSAGNTNINVFDIGIDLPEPLYDVDGLLTLDMAFEYLGVSNSRVERCWIRNGSLEFGANTAYHNSASALTLGGNSFNTVSYCEFDNVSASISYFQASYCNFTFNEVNKSWDDAFLVGSAGIGHTIEHNYIDAGNPVTGLSGSTASIYLLNDGGCGGADFMANNCVRHNTIRNNNDHDPAVGLQAGVAILGDSRDNDIDQNDVAACKVGLWIGTGNHYGAHVSKNKFHENTANGIRIEANVSGKVITGLRLSENDVWNNVINGIQFYSNSTLRAELVGNHFYDDQGSPTQTISVKATNESGKTLVIIESGNQLENTTAYSTAGAGAANIVFASQAWNKIMGQATSAAFDIQPGVSSFTRLLYNNGAMMASVNAGEGSAIATYLGSGATYPFTAYRSTDSSDPAFRVYSDDGYYTKLHTGSRHVIFTDNSGSYNDVALRNFQGDFLLYYNHSGSNYHTFASTGAVTIGGALTATSFAGSGASITGVPIATGISGLGSGVATFLATPSSSNLKAAVTDETGSGALVFANTPTLVTPNVGVATGTSLVASSGIGAKGGTDVANYALDAGENIRIGYTGPPTIVLNNGTVQSNAVVLTSGATPELQLYGNKLTIASNGTVTATTFAGSGASLTSIPQSGVTNLVSDLAAKQTKTVIVVGTSIAQGGDGIGDYVCAGTADQTEINNAIAALGSTGGVVYIKPGNYVISASIEMENNTTLTGAHRATVLKYADGGGWDGLITNSLFAAGFGTKQQNITVENLTVNGNRANALSSPPQDMVVFSDVDNLIVRGMYIYDCPDSGIVFDNDSLYAKITDNIVDGAVDIGIYVSDTKHTLVANNQVRNTDSYGIRVIRYTSGYAQFVNVADNVVYNCGQGLSVSGIMVMDSSENCNVTGNVVSYSGKHGIQVDTSAYNSVTGNHVSFSDQHGIYINSNSRGVVTGNLCNRNSQQTSNTYSGIYLNNCADCTVTGNRSGDTGSGTRQKYGIEEAGTSDNNTIVGNMLDRNGTSALLVVGANTIYGLNSGATSSVLGTISGGTWNGSVIGPAYGGTGVANNAASTLTISGNFATTLTISGVTSVTLPTSGTLATLAGTETFTNKTLVTPDLGTPSAATLTNATGLPISTGVSGLGTGVATFLATPSSANLAAALTDETGTAGSVVFSASPTFTGSSIFSGVFPFMLLIFAVG